MGVSAALIACIFLVASLIASTVTRCRSEKKNYFILCLFAVLIYATGSFLELTSTGTREAFEAVKVMYAGGCFIPSLFLLFTLDYCEVRIRGPVLTALTIAPLVNLLLVWTTDRTLLVYRSFDFSGAASFHGLRVLEQGPLYNLFWIIGLVCVAVSVVVLIGRFRVWGSRYRKTLFMLACFSVGPLATNFIYIITTYVFESNVVFNATPFVLAATATAFYYSVLRYDLFDFTSRAKSLTLDFSKDAVVVVDADMNYSSANDVARVLFPPLAHINKGHPIVAVEGWPKALTQIDLSDEPDDVGFTLEKDGESLFYRAGVKPFYADGKRGGRNNHALLGMVMIIRDITSEHRLMRELEEAAYTDELTGLYNRRHFIELAAMGLVRARRTDTPCSVMIIDLDHFKDVNDTFGHLAGDAVLRAVARKLKGAARVYDLFARYGGEEFVALVDGASLRDAERLAERIRRQIDASVVRYEDSDIKITCSIGVSQITERDRDIDDVISRADTALYQAKADGRNLVRTLV